MVFGFVKKLANTVSEAKKAVEKKVEDVQEKGLVETVSTTVTATASNIQQAVKEVISDEPKARSTAIEAKEKKEEIPKDPVQARAYIENQEDRARMKWFSMEREARERTTHVYKKQTRELRLGAAAPLFNTLNDEEEEDRIDVENEWLNSLGALKEVEIAERFKNVPPKDMFRKWIRPNLKIGKPVINEKKQATLKKRREKERSKEADVVACVNTIMESQASVKAEVQTSTLEEDIIDRLCFNVQELIDNLDTKDRTLFNELLATARADLKALENTGLMKMNNTSYIVKERDLNEIWELCEQLNQTLADIESYFGQSYKSNEDFRFAVEETAAIAQEVREASIAGSYSQPTILEQAIINDQFRDVTKDNDMAVRSNLKRVIPQDKKTDNFEELKKTAEQRRKATEKRVNSMCTYSRSSSHNDEQHILAYNEKLVKELDKFVDEMEAKIKDITIKELKTTYGGAKEDSPATGFPGLDISEEQADALFSRSISMGDFDEDELQELAEAGLDDVNVALDRDASSLIDPITVDPPIQ